MAQTLNSFNLGINELFWGSDNTNGIIKNLENNINESFEDVKKSAFEKAKEF